jgi:hypothetical protein
MIWSYVGETGEELPCCNSHSLAIVSDLFCSYLVVYGGANPDMGPLMRTYVALLPNIFQGAVSYQLHYESMNPNETIYR